MSQYLLQGLPRVAAPRLCLLSLLAVDSNLKSDRPLRRNAPGAQVVPAHTERPVALQATARRRGPPATQAVVFSPENAEEMRFSLLSVPAAHRVE